MPARPFPRVRSIGRPAPLRTAVVRQHLHKGESQRSLIYRTHVAFVKIFKQSSAEADRRHVIVTHCASQAPVSGAFLNRSYIRRRRRSGCGATFVNLIENCSAAQRMSRRRDDTRANMVKSVFTRANKSRPAGRFTGFS